MKTERQEAKLEVMRGAPPDGAWARAKTSDGQPYAYSFEGGKKGAGHLNSQVGDGAQVYTVKLKPNDKAQSKSKYAIERVDISGDDKGQLEMVEKDRSDNHATIFNKNELEMQAYYLVVVRRDDGVLIECDPMISNDPRRG
jgi:hypothetical protein